MIVKVSGLVKKLYPNRIWNGRPDGKRLYLSFDDGPIPDVTPWVLQQLEKYDAKATFFCIGENINKHPEVFKKVLSAGHRFGNHTYNHLNGWKTPFQQYIDNAQKAQREMDLHFKENEPPLFRPPYGKITNRQAKQLSKLGFKIVMWDVLSVDYGANVSAKVCLQNVLENAVPGSIIVFHDSLKAEKNLREVLPKVLDHFSNLGFKFERLEKSNF
ncbi:polysaccharide deacetylase family protein [Salinimicrobium soli]|uniref:polysaccharide deacetylase family protein n=1 Tax=Salinimicrobium soli TaxID=1254399 RepID=UPI003AAC0889